MSWVNVHITPINGKYIYIYITDNIIFKFDERKWVEYKSKLRNGKPSLAKSKHMVRKLRLNYDKIRTSSEYIYDLLGCLLSVYVFIYTHTYYIYIYILIIYFLVFA